MGYTVKVSVICWKCIHRQVWQEVMLLNIIYLCWHPLNTHALVVTTNTHMHKEISKDIHSEGLEADTPPRKVV